MHLGAVKTARMKPAGAGWTAGASSAAGPSGTALAPGPSGTALAAGPSGTAASARTAARTADAPVRLLRSATFAIAAWRHRHDENRE